MRSPDDAIKEVVGAELLERNWSPTPPNANLPFKGGKKAQLSELIPAFNERKRALGFITLSIKQTKVAKVLKRMGYVVTKPCNRWCMWYVEAPAPTE